MKKLIFFSLASLFTNLSFSQNDGLQSRTDKSSDPKLIEFMNRHNSLNKKEEVVVQQSEYMGYDATLKSYFAGNTIPAATPKYSATQTRKEYVQQLNNWIASNKQFLKPEYKNALITE